MSSITDIVRKRVIPTNGLVYEATGLRPAEIYFALEFETPFHDSEFAQRLFLVNELIVTYNGFTEVFTRYVASTSYPVCLCASFPLTEDENSFSIRLRTTRMPEYVDLELFCKS